MKKVYIFSFLMIFCYANSPSEAYKKALEYEKRGQIKEALFWYKKSAKMSLAFAKKAKKVQFCELSKGVKKKRFVLPFEPYKSNYILPAVYDFTYHSGRKRVETKFQFSIKKSLYKNLFGMDDTLYFGYTQTSFWQTAKKSSPFRETNYAPEIFLDIPYTKYDSHLKSYQIGLLHQSNGRAGLDSRSWNRIYLQGNFKFENLKFMPRVWYRIPERDKTSPLDADGDDNPDIWKYMGYGDIKIVYAYKKHLFALTIRDNLRTDQNKGSLEAEWSFPVWDDKFYIYLQGFSGYAESLIDYNKRNNKIGIGFAISR